MNGQRERAAIAIAATVREVDDPPAWAVEYVATALEHAAAEARAEGGSTIKRLRAFIDSFTERGGVHITATDERWILLIRRILDGSA